MCSFTLDNLALEIMHRHFCNFLLVVQLGLLTVREDFIKINRAILEHDYQM